MTSQNTTSRVRITEISSEQLARALGWYGEHQSHVDRLVRTDGPAYPPAGSEASRPELWKAAHWRWLEEKARG